MNNERKYKKCVTGLRAEELKLSSFEEINLRAVKGYLINGFRYLIKPINGYICKYAVVRLIKGRKMEVLYNSDSINFLDTVLKTKHCIQLTKKTTNEKLFIDKTYNKKEWLPELEDPKWLEARRYSKIKRQLERFEYSQ
jgi:hypothetical protein